MENQNLTWLERLNDSLSRSVTVKLLSITFLILLLLIPKTMITHLIAEREQTMKEAAAGISGSWSGSQRVTGPVLVIPYLHEGQAENGKVLTIKKTAFFLPDSLNIESRVIPEKRYRGIYTVIVYRSVITLSGNFSRPDFTSLGIDEKNVLWSQASLQAGISDLRGIEQGIRLIWEADEKEFNPGNTDKGLFSSGISAKLSLLRGDDFAAPFHINLPLKGSENLYFVPVGRITRAGMNSTWNAPSFTGSFLPDRRDINADGFQAAWKILHFNRNYPQQWADRDQSFDDSAFGVIFLIPADHYLKSLRSVKYSILVIALTFLVFFLVEILIRQRIHPIQYVLVGLSLTLFYVLLLSISEQTGFNPAYGISSLMIILLIYLYARSVVKSGKAAYLMLLFLLLNYGFIYVIIQMEEYALLVGSLGLFAALGLTMFITRKVNWYGDK